jgi:hypothetical protein
VQRSGHPERRQHADRRRRRRQGRRADLARAAGRQALAPLKATVDVAGLPLSGSAAIDGTARGRYRMVKSVAVFRLERTSGDVAVSYPGGRQTYGMETLAGALVPDGAADLTCRGDSLTIKAENLTLDLRRVKR